MATFSLPHFKTVYNAKEYCFGSWVCVLLSWTLGNLVLTSVLYLNHWLSLLLFWDLYPGKLYLHYQNIWLKNHGRNTLNFAMPRSCGSQKKLTREETIFPCSVMFWLCLTNCDYVRHTSELWYLNAQKYKKH